MGELFFTDSPCCRSFYKDKWNQFMMFNILERRFNILGFPLASGYLFVCTLYDNRGSLSSFYGNFGRIFCGWICPQTIFLEMVFRRINIG
jgi:polyferredoxin